MKIKTQCKVKKAGIFQLDTLNVVSGPDPHVFGGRISAMVLNPTKYIRERALVMSLNPASAWRQRPYGL